MAVVNYWIKSLVTPMPTKDTVVRRVKSLDVAMLVDFAIAQNVEGNTRIPLDAIGAPLRLRTNKAGEVQFSASGKPSVKVCTEINAFGTMIHNNIIAGIQADIDRVYEENADAVKAMKEAAEKASAPILQSDTVKLAAALKARAEAEAKAIAEAEAKAPETPKATAKPKHQKNSETPKAIAEVKAEVEAPAPERELVGASV